MIIANEYVVKVVRPPLLLPSAEVTQSLASMSSKKTKLSVCFLTNRLWAVTGFKPSVWHMENSGGRPDLQSHRHHDAGTFFPGVLFDKTVHFQPTVITLVRYMNPTLHEFPANLSASLNPL